MKSKKIDLTIPFDEILLPSRGFFYKNKKDTLLVRYMTSKEEYVLTSPSLIEGGKAIRIILDSVIVDNEINIDELLIGDKNAILIYLRSTSYGDNVKLNFQCPHCEEETETQFKLSSFELKDLELPGEDNLFSFTLPKMKIHPDLIENSHILIEKNKLPFSKVKIKFKPLNISEEFELNKETNKNKITEKFKLQIKSINGVENKKFINYIIKNMTAFDSMSFREYCKKVEPGIENEINIKCSKCLTETKQEITMGYNFFGLQPEYRESIMEEVFLSHYYGKGITKENAQNMAVSERKWVINRINEEIDRQNKAQERAMKKK